MERQPIRDKHQAAIDAVFADGRVPSGVVDLINKLLSDAEDIESDRDEAIADADELRGQIEQRDSHQDEALQAVKYWMHDALILHKPMSDPRKILRTVEDALR